MKTDKDVQKFIDETGVDFVPENEQGKDITVCESRFVPFPIDELPELVAEYVRQTATSISCDPAMVVNVLLAAFATAIGNTRQVVIKSGWTEPAILWTVTIGDSGCKKSVPFNEVKTFFNESESREVEIFKKEMSMYKARKVQHDADVKAWVKEGCLGTPPTEPPKPRLQKLILVDATMEATAYHLDGNPRGAGLFRDELAGWFGSFGQYKKGGAEETFWIECNEAKTYSQDRKGSDLPIDIARCSVSVTGTIQPTVFGGILAEREKYVTNGMLHRFLFAAPPEPPLENLDAIIDPDLRQTMQTLFNELRSLSFYMGADEKEQPENVYLTPEAYKLFGKIRIQYDSEKRKMTKEQSDLKSYWSKMPGRIARIALIYHLTRCYSGEEGDPSRIDVETMRSAIAIGRWYANEASRVYTMLGCGSETDDAREWRKIMDEIRKLGGAASIPEIYGKLKKYRDETGREKLEKILLSRVKEGEIRMESPNTGGRGTVRFILLE